MKFRAVCLSFVSWLVMMLGVAAGSAWAGAQAQEFKLANGMRIIVQEDRRAPTVAHMVWYRVGSIDEQNGTTGVAHVLEHMMFKGSEKRRAEDRLERAESRNNGSLAGLLNAFDTNKDGAVTQDEMTAGHADNVATATTHELGPIDSNKTIVPLAELPATGANTGIGEATYLTGYTDETIEASWSLVQQLAQDFCGRRADEVFRHRAAPRGGAQRHAEPTRPIAGAEPRRGRL